MEEQGAEGTSEASHEQRDSIALAESKALALNNNDYSNIKYVLFKVLSALKHFYSFKELEDRLGVSAQILWRYVTLRSVPERETAEKLLAKIAAERLVDDALNRSLEAGELWQVLSSPGIASLIELKALEMFKGDKINAILAAPDGYSAVFAATLSEAFHARLCVASKTPYSRHVIVKNYKISQDYYESMMLPRECVPRKGRVLIVVVDLSKVSQILALADIAKLKQSTVVGVVGVIGPSDKVEEAIKEKLGLNVKALSLLRPCNHDEQSCSKQDLKLGRVELEGRQEPA